MGFSLLENMSYLKWQEKTITDFSDENINNLYNEGFVFTRIEKGLMNQTRSVRINLSQFDLSSENRRVLRKTETKLIHLLTVVYLYVCVN